ncbi:copper resistance system multicopper oxidase [Woodsholea maritima]|uniref:copper resistance system multicopper oxidase n=1 Tax=Woodsholea maritima TaxID=240237 RepID=UPI00037B83FB|nr:copper resistance system multicopper oxidase [Woodsholea maritima]
MISRRSLLTSGLGVGASLLATSMLPAWARSASQGNLGLPQLTGTEFDLTIGEFPATIGGRIARAIGVNQTLPAPLLRFREGEDITINVTNTLREDTSLHWHGLLVPFQMDGVPGVTFPGIKPGETFQYRFNLAHNGTYWYHSHSGFQEPLGLYGPLIIDPAGSDPVVYDREYVLVLSDWSFEHPRRIFEKLKSDAENYNFQKRTLADFLGDVRREGFAETLSTRAMWAGMRMSSRDISDVTGSTYDYLINGHTTADNWNGVIQPGERVRLRLINASAMTIFNIRMPGLTMTVVAADGLNVQPLDIDEFQMGVAETYDVIITVPDAGVYGLVAEAVDRSGQVMASFGPQPGMRASEPDLRPVPSLTMRDMGMDHGDPTDHVAMDHTSMRHDDPHAGHGAHNNHVSPAPLPVERPDLRRGPGIANIVSHPLARLDEPGIGLEDVAHRTLTYADLRSLEPSPDTRPPEREIEVHLTSNMERYMWSFDGVGFSEITAPIRFHQGERVRMTLVNNTMMAHPIHLHGMFFDVVNGGGDHKPRKHTIIVKPSEKLSVDISADAVGDWAFHCHLLYHMHAGMMQVVQVLPRETPPDPHSAHQGHHHTQKGGHHD